MLEAPQDRLVKCVQPTDPEADSGRYVVAKADISPGELVLLAAPYAVAMNPNEMPSAMYIVSKIEEWVAVSGRTNATINYVPELRKKRGPLPLSAANQYVPLTPCTTLCCNCLRRIPDGTFFLNYETIRQVSECVISEHAKREFELWMKEKENVSGLRVVGLNGEGGTTEEGDDSKQIKKSQKLSKSTRMRSKGYLALKQKLSEAAAARNEVAMHNYHIKLAHLEKAQEVSWPERVVERERNLPDDVAGQGVCGCAGCGVVVYCSQGCWMEQHRLHRMTGACRTMRDVYPVLMKAFMAHAGNNTKQAGTKQFSPQSWSPEHWLKRVGEEAAWEIQSLLLAALLVARCVKEGYVNHMAEETEDVPTADSSSDSGEGGQGATCQVLDQPVSPLTAEGDELIVCGAKVTVGEAPAEAATTTTTVLIATDSTVPQEVMMIRALRLRSGGTVEVMDPKALEQKDDTNTAEVKSQLYVHLKDHAVLSLCNNREATHAIRNPRWVDAAQLVTNLSVLHKKSRSTIRSYYRRFVKLVLPWLSDAESTETKLTVAASFFDRMCSAVQCNSFGLFDANGNCVGVALYPEASFFNHSCYPNICRVTCRGCLAAFYALRSIKKGDSLNICYVDIQESSTAERRRTLLMSYRFYCQCKRCCGAVTTTELEIRLCDSCIVRGYMCPVAPPSVSHWGMDAVREAICSVCRQRAPWIRE